MKEDYELLAKYFGGLSQQKGPANADVAKFMLLNANRSKPLGPGANNSADNEPSLMGKIFDVLSRPNYAIANFVKETNEGNPNLEALWEGFSGKQKTTFKDVLKQQGADDVTAGGVGFVLDVGLDPINYLPIAGIAKAIKGLKGAKEAPEVTRAQEILSRGEPARPESFGLEIPPREVPPALKNVPLPVDALQGLAPKISAKAPEPIPVGMPEQLGLDIPTGASKYRDVTTTKAAPVEKSLPEEVPGQLAMKLGIPAVVSKATSIVDDIAKNSPEAFAKIAPLPNPVKTPAIEKLADNILLDFNPHAATAKINKISRDTLNAKQQLKLLYRSREIANKNVYRKGRNPDKVKAEVNDAAIKGYLAAEQRLVDAGWVPRIGTGENVRLSDVLKDLASRGVPITDNILNEYGSVFNPGSELAQSIENVRAREVMTEAPVVNNIVNKINDAKTETRESNILSDGQLKDVDGFLKKFGQATAKKELLSPAAQVSTAALVRMAIDSGKSAAEIAVEQSARMIDEILASGKQNPRVAEVLTRALEKDHGKLPAWAVTDNKAVEFLMGRVATWWGQRDLRPFSLNAIGAADATAAARGKALDNLFTGLSTAQRVEVLNLARGNGVASSPVTEQVATQVRRMLDNLSGQARGSSVVTRAALDMKEVNKWMGQYGVGFKFNRGKGTDEFGKSFDYSKGTDWVNSWKTAEIKKDPEEFLFKFQQAVEQATREKALYEEMGQRFGKTVPGGGFRTKIKGHPYLEGYYFPEDIAKQIPRVIKDWSIPNWAPKSKFVQFYDRVMSMWKSGVTIYRPGHHVRNYAGDIYLGWMDGVNGMRPYQLALKVQRSMKDAYTDLMDVDQLVELGLLSRNMGTPKAGEILFRNKSGVPFTAEQIGAVAHQKGLLEHTRTLEDIIDLGDSGRKGILNAKPFGGRVQKFARGASELTSHNARLAHFIDKIQKSRGENLAEIFEQASRRARKWHPTGLDLTDFEKRYMRRIIPFYSWMRKSLPLLLHGLVMNPGKVLVPSKAYEGIAQAQGMETEGRDQPFPVDQMFPSWIRAQGLGPVDLPEGVLGSFSNQMPPGYTMAGVGLNPLSDLMAQFEEPQKTILSSLTPAAQVPMELLQGSKNFTGEPITGADARPGALNQYVGEQIPIWSALQGITGITPFGTETRKVEKSGNDARIESLINWFTAAGIRGTGPYERQALFEKRDQTQGNQRQLTADFLERFGK